MRMPRQDGAAPREALAIDDITLHDALGEAAARCGRLTDEQVRSLRGRRRAATAASVAMVAAVGMLLVVGTQWAEPGPATPPAWSRVLTTGQGQRGSLRMADGSTVRLNGATRVRIVYTATARTARLLTGQAFFDIHHDPSRPFVVRAGDGQARVLGTAFDLDITRGQVALAVYRGAVGFDPIGRPAGVVVRAGYRSSIRGHIATAPSPFDPSLPDWRQGWVDTAGMRLGDLVEVLDRQSGVRIADPAEPLRSIRVSGRFRTDRPRALLDAIGPGFGFTVVDGPQGLSLKKSS